MDTKKTIETIKSCLIVVLSLSAVLLLYFFWENLSLKNLRWEWNSGKEQVAVPVEKPGIPQVILPAEVQIHLADELYTVILPEDYDVWQLGSSALAKFSKGEGSGAEEISEEKYREVMSDRSLQIKFNYAVPFEGFCRQFSVSYSRYGSIRNMTVLAYSDATPESLFVHDGANDRYYRLVGPAAETAVFAQVLDAVEQDGTYSPYYPASSYLGVNNSEAVLPVFLERTLTRVTSVRNLAGEERDEASDVLARTFFGDNLDFVRRLEDSNGTITYMYDYGQRVLTVDKLGVALYKEELAEATATTGFYGSLDAAIDFVANHGGWYPKCEELRLEERGLTPFLWSGREIQSGNRNGWRFSFGYRRGNEVFYNDAGAAIVVEVFDGQITYYHRNVFDSILVRGMVSSLWEAKDSANTIAQNTDWIYETLLAEGVFTEEEESDQKTTGPHLLTDEQRFDRIGEAVQRVQEGYILSSGKAQAERCWVIQIKGVLFFFELFSGEPMGYTVVGR